MKQKNQSRTLSPRMKKVSSAEEQVYSTQGQLENEVESISSALFRLTVYASIFI